MALLFWLLTHSDLLKKGFSLIFSFELKFVSFASGFCRNCGATLIFSCSNLSTVFRRQRSLIQLEAVFLLFFSWLVEAVSTHHHFIHIELETSICLILFQHLKLAQWFFQKSLFSGVFGLVCSGGLVANRRENLYFSNFHSTAPIQTCQHFLWILSLSPNCDKLSLSQKSSAVQTTMTRHSIHDLLWQYGWAAL